MNKNIRRCLLFVLFVALTLVLCGCAVKEQVRADGLPFLPQPEKAGELYVHFIDVGQGNAILIRLPDSRIMLIDSGSGSQSDKLMAYLKKEHIDKIDWLVCTHPHEDHIGNMDSVIKSFVVGELYMPKVTANTKTFRDLLQAAKNKQLQVKTAKAGVLLAEDVKAGWKAEMFAPNSEKYEELNDYSAVVKIKYRNNSVLITGDAEKLSEKEMLSKGYDLKANVLQIGHHGSSSSTSKAFLQAVAPQYAVICVGADNDYGHPHKETLNLLEKSKITLYRTDTNGSVVAVSDGAKISFFAN